jgi:hypothetical protein
LNVVFDGRNDREALKTLRHVRSLLRPGPVSRTRFFPAVLPLRMILAFFAGSFRSRAGLLDKLGLAAGTIEVSVALLMDGLAAAIFVLGSASLDLRRRADGV